MRKRIPTIPERGEDLQKRLKAEKDVCQRQRLEMLYLLRSGQAKTRKQVADLLGVHRHTIGSWLEAYERGGLQEACTIHPAPGKPPRMSPEVLEALKARLGEPQGFASYGQLQEDLSREPGGVLSSSRGHRIVRYQLKAKPKSPWPSAKKRSGGRSLVCADLLPAGRGHPG